MTFKDDYERKKFLLFKDKKICKSNRDIFKEFFEFQEEKLKRINDNAKLDEPSYKTLCGYINRLKNVNKWFENKDWKKLTLEDIKKVYKNLEEGSIFNRFGKRFADRKSYYSKIFKYKPFDLAGQKANVEKVLVFFTDRRKKEVNFVNRENFKKIVSVVKNPHHLALLWLAWDIGENINTFLGLTSSNFKRKINSSTKEPEYIVWLPQGQLKRSRTQRSEPTLFPETVRYLDIVLNGLKPEDKLFKFEYRQSLKFFDSAVTRSKTTCEPTGKKPSWKDLRSGMACNLFSNYGWHSDDINLRLGHSIMSRELEVYFSYLAGQGKRVKKLHYNNSLEKVREEFEELKLIEKGQRQRLENQEREIDLINKNYQKIAKDMSILRVALQDNREEAKSIEKKDWEKRKELSTFNLLNTDTQSAS